MNDLRSSSLDRFLALVRREMRADDVFVGEPGQPASDAANVLRALLPDGRSVTVVFAERPEDRDALQRRLDMIATTFAQSIEEAKERTSRMAPATSLQDELQALTKRAQALDAVVIDANSPVVWGSTSLGSPESTRGENVVPLIEVSRSDLVASVFGDPDRNEDRNEDAGQGQDLPQPGRRPVSANEVDDVGFAAEDDAVASADVQPLSSRAVEDVRALSQLSSLHKGGHLRHVVREQSFGYVAQSFAGIYLLVIVYGAPFDEIRAERCIGEALPRIERLVMALPPMDPPPAPIAGVISMRRGRRR